MAASERLYELWLLYYAQVSPPHAVPLCPQLRAPRACCTCAPRPWGRVDERAPGGLGLRTHVCAAPRPPVPPALIPGG